jgi:hypothetical protein
MYRHILIPTDGSELTAATGWASLFRVRTLFNEVFMCISCACYHTPLIDARP